jgi:hypothetical protein
MVYISFVIAKKSLPDPRFSLIIFEKYYTFKFYIFSKFCIWYNIFFIYFAQRCAIILVLFVENTILMIDSLYIDLFFSYF